jgi:hypothetical protein
MLRELQIVESYFPLSDIITRTVWFHQKISKR